MSQPQNPQPAKLVIGILMNDKSLLDGVFRHLEQLFGRIDMVSNWMTFDFTTYYATEMGDTLHRRMLAFKRLVDQTSLAMAKLATNDVEKKYTEDGRRSVNIDPGYLLNERFVLATGKNYTHRIYIGSGIYADLTLVFQRGDYQSLPWTYPDYRSEPVISFLKQVRKKFAWDLRWRVSSGQFRHSP